MNGSQPQTHFHGEVTVQRNGTQVRINIFDDNRERVYQEIAYAIAQFSSDIKPATAAQRELTRAEQAKAAKAVAPVAKAAGSIAGQPVCQECSFTDQMELIRWSDQDTGEQRAAWKCQRCKKWVGSKKKQPVEELPY